MDELAEKIKVSFKNNGFVYLLVLFLVVDIISIPFVFSRNQGRESQCLPQEETSLQKDLLPNPEPENIPKISDTKGPQIDTQSAAVSMTVTFKAPEKPIVPEASEKIIDSEILPVKIWIFLFLTYVVLLIFNLAYNFKRTKKIQWFWELALTFLALSVWYALGRDQNNAWYPTYIVKIGILIYALYLYFFNKKQHPRVLSL